MIKDLRTQRKILYVNAPVYVGGAEISLLTLMAHLDSEYYQSLLVVGGEGRLAEMARTQGLETFVHAFPWFRKRYPWRYPASIIRLAYIIVTQQATLLHTNCDHSLRYVMHAARLAQVPYVSHVRDFVRTWFEPHNIVALKRAAAVIANSKAIAARCLEAGLNPRQIVTIYNPIDLVPFEQVKAEKQITLRSRWNIPSDALVVGIVGQIQPIKGHREFILAALELVTEIPNVHFVVVGSTPPGKSNDEFSSELKQTVAQSGYARNFHFVGFQRNIPAVMSVFDILTVPSWDEPFGRVAVEGMAAGCALVTTNAGGLSEIVSHEKDGLVVQPKDVNALVLALRHLAHDPILRRKLSEEGPRSAKRFTPEKHVQQMQDLYDSIVSTK